MVCFFDFVVFFRWIWRVRDRNEDIDIGLSVWRCAQDYSHGYCTWVEPHTVSRQAPSDSILCPRDVGVDRNSMSSAVLAASKLVY